MGCEHCDCDLNHVAGVCSDCECSADCECRSRVGGSIEDVPKGFSCFTYALSNYFNFSGRARRREYWYFVLFSILFSFLVGFIDGVFGFVILDGAFGVLGLLFSLFIIIPQLALTVRRLHDLGFSGWWWLLNFVPIIGWLLLLVFMMSDSRDAGDRYGPPRK